MILVAIWERSRLTGHRLHFDLALAICEEEQLVPVDLINLWLYICPRASSDARIQGSCAFEPRVETGIWPNALDPRRVRRRRARCIDYTLFYGLGNCVVHLICALRRLLLKCLFARSVGEGAFAG